MMTILLEGSRANAAVSEPQQAISNHCLRRVPHGVFLYQLLREAIEHFDASALRKEVAAVPG